LGKEIVELFRERLRKGAEDMSDRLEGIPGKNRIPVVWREYRLIGKTKITPRVTEFVFEIADEGSVTGDTEFAGAFPHVRLKCIPGIYFTRAYSVASGDKNEIELGIVRDD